MTEEILETLFLLFIAGVLALHDCHAVDKTPPKASCYWKTCKMLDLEKGFSQCEEGLGDTEAMVKAKLRAMARDDHFINRCVPVGEDLKHDNESNRSDSDHSGDSSRDLRSGSGPVLGNRVQRK